MPTWARRLCETPLTISKSSQEGRTSVQSDASADDREELSKSENAPTWVETTAMLLSIEYQDRTEKGAPFKKALILAFRGTEPLKNANVSASLAFPQTHLSTMTRGA